MYHKTIDDVLKKVKSNKFGLNNQEVEKRFNKDIVNEIVNKNKVTLSKIIINQLKDFMVLILLLASILSFVLKDIVEGVVILIIILIDTVIGVIQEYRAEFAIESLKKLSPSYSLVKRDNKIVKVLSKNLVIGDIVLLEEGCLVPADMRLIKSFGLRISESSLTGETLSINKTADAVLNIDTPLSERINMAYSSSLVTYGHGEGVVTAIGMNTEVGKIAHLLAKENKIDTPLKKKLEDIGKKLSIIGLIVCILFFIIGLILKRDIKPLFMTSIALAISLIPEGLPATSTIVLAIGVQRMLKKEVLVRNLSSVETLGSTSVICFDKTGTLTENKMHVTNVFTNNELELFKCIALANNANYQEGKFIGDPTEVSLGEHIGMEYLRIRSQYARLKELAFDSKRKRMTVLVKNSTTLESFSKGALEELLPFCTYELIKGDKVLLSEKRKKELLKISEDFSRQACRVMAFSKKDLQDEEQELEKENVFLGLVAMFDPPKSDVKEILEQTKRSGIKVVMMTGDHPLTAETIAKKVGIYQNEAINGYELNNIDDEQLKSLVKKHNVFARVTPYDKLRIIKAYKANGEVVAMIGDGVNDAPSLKSADIGVAMGKNGTDVAKDASDMILLDDNLSSLISAIFEGRKVFKNIQKVIQFLLVGNVGEILTLLIAIMMGFKYMPISALHILFINLVTDTLPALALGVDSISREILNDKPKKQETFVDKEFFKHVLIFGLIIASITLMGYYVFYNRTLMSGKTFIDAKKTGQTAAFIILTFSQLFHSFNQRSKVSSLFEKPFNNKYLIYALLISFFFALFVLFLPFTRKLFAFVNLCFFEWLFLLSLSLIPLFICEIIKLIKRIRRSGKY